MTPNIPKGMKPFNIEEAMRDVTKVRTRNGKTIRQMFIADKVDDAYKLIVVNVCGRIKTYRMDGTKCDNLYEDSDLFLIDDEPESIVAKIESSEFELYLPKYHNIIVSNGQFIPPGKYKLVKID